MGLWNLYVVFQIERLFFLFFFSVNSRFSQVAAGLGLGSKYVDTISAFHFNTYVVEEVAKGVHNDLTSIRKHYRKCHQGASAKNHFWYIKASLSFGEFL